MYILNRILGVVVNAVIAYLTYRLDEKAVKKGNYIKGWGNAKFTLWSLPFYISSIMLFVFIAAFFL